MENKILSKSDYEEPTCPFCMPGDITPIPIGRVIEKLDEYLGRNDYDSAERHLKYWLDEATSLNDGRGKLTVLNELIGLYRKTSKENEALLSAKSTLELAENLGLQGSIVMGTTLVNAATAYKAFDKAAEALTLYQNAKIIYEAQLESDDNRLGGLYNNMALAVMETGDYDKAEELFNKAISVMERVRDGELEIAVTYCNLADLAVARNGIENSEQEITALLERAEELLNTATLPRNGYYAFVCEKCAPTFGYYGWFAFENELNNRAVRIYEGA